MMRAIAIDRFGGIETFALQELPIPTIGAGEILMRVEVAGVGEWDSFEREGGYAKLLDMRPTFPYVLGSEGAGTVAAVGAGVQHVKKGDRVYACGFLNPKGGFYAEYVAVDASYVAAIPGALTTVQAAVMSGVGTTALRGLEDTLALKPNETVMIFGASGGVGHLAVQLAKRMGARVLAVASGDDGVALAQQLGADTAVNGHEDDVRAVAHAFAPNGLDAALLTASAPKEVLGLVRDGGRIAYPYGIEPEPKAPVDVQLNGYYGKPDTDIISRIDQMIERGPFTVHVARVFSLDQAAEAHRALNEHYLGKLALQVQ